MLAGQDLGLSLITMYPSSIKEVRFLRRGSDWYSIDALSGVDVLISLVEDFDVSRALKAAGVSLGNKSPLKFGAEFRQVKPAMITIAWMRTSFLKWLSKPYLGNFDLILVTSSLARDIVKTISTSYGFKAKCSMGCPYKTGIPTTKVDDISNDAKLLGVFNRFVDSKKGIRNSSISDLKELLHKLDLGFKNERSSLLSYNRDSNMGLKSNSIVGNGKFYIGNRMTVPVRVMRPAVNSLRLCGGNFENEKDAVKQDFLFFGSNHHSLVKESNIEFLKGQSQMWKGTVVGKGWVLNSHVDVFYNFSDYLDVLNKSTSAVYFISYLILVSIFFSNLIVYIHRSLETQTLWLTMITLFGEI